MTVVVEGLTKFFGSKAAVGGLSFEVQPGVVTGFLGPNGSGKSTTMRCMLNLDRPDAGRTMFDGRPYVTLDQPLREVGAVLDAGYVHPGRTARNHLRWMAASNRLPSRRVDEVLELVGLTAVAGNRVKTFSLGMKQRLGLAAVMLGDPKVVILDEPGNGLDPEGIRWVRDVLVHLAGQGRTVLVSSHLLSEMAMMATTLIVIGQGQLVEQSSVGDFLDKYADHWVRFASPQVSAVAESLSAGGAAVERIDDATVHVRGVTAVDVGEVAARCNATVHELSNHTGSLEDAFLLATASVQEYHAGAL
jgi:ABC-2 type transport system ATP-binding protein